jgi:hypothetical protein
MFEYLNNWLRQIETGYGVNPLVFAAIYSVGVVPFWLSLYKTLQAVKNKNYGQARTFSIILGIVIIAPFTYVAIFGRNLPAWFWIVATAVITCSAYSVIKRSTRAHT